MEDFAIAFEQREQTVKPDGYIRILETHAK